MNRHMSSPLLPLLLLMLFTATPAAAGDRDAQAGVEGLLAPQTLLGGVVRDGDISLVFDHLRATMAAAAAGREAPAMPGPLISRIDEAGSELRQRGTLLGLALSYTAERALREVLREFTTAPRAAE
jgi:hypothetical protein